MMQVRVLSFVLIIFLVSSCVSTNNKKFVNDSKPAQIETKFPASIEDNNGIPIIYGSYKKYSNRSYIIAAAQFVSRNKLAPIQILERGENSISIFINDNTHFVKSNIEFYAVHGDEYFLNFELNESDTNSSIYTRAPFSVKRIWITNSIGATVKEVIKWSDTRHVRELYSPNLS